MKIAFIFLITTLLSLHLRSQDCKTIPPLNKKIVAFVNAKKGKEVGDYYCFALVESSYKSAGIEYVNYMIGDKINYDTDCVFPGDVIGLKDIEFKYKRNDTTFTKKYPTEHFLIIVKVKSKGSFVTAEQEDINGVRKVRLIDFDLKQISKGKPVVYRPKKQS